MRGCCVACMYASLLLATRVWSVGGGGWGRRVRLVFAGETLSRRANLSMQEIDGEALARRFASCNAARAAERARFASQWLPLQSTSGRHHDNVFVSHALKAAYIANQKAGSRSILRMMERFGPRPVTTVPYHHWASASSASSYSKYLTFTFVCDPLRTFLSGASEVASRHYHGLRTLCRTHGRYWTVPCGADVLGPLLDDVLSRRCIGQAAYHIWPQTVKLDVRLSRPIDFIGRLEHLEHDFGDLLRRLNRSTNISTLLTTSTAHEHGTDRCGRAVVINTSILAKGTSLRATLCGLLASDYACGFGMSECDA